MKLSWRQYQAIYTIAIHARDLGALILAAGSVAGVIWLVG